MHPHLLPLSENLILNYPLVIRTLDELDENLSLKIFVENMNCFNWILGHLVTGRHCMVSLAGAKLEDTPYWSNLYGKGSVFDPDNIYADLDKMQESWVEASEVLMGVLAALGEIELIEECPIPFPIKDKTIRGALAFLTLHECYHIGQLGMLRHAAGLSRFFD